MNKAQRAILEQYKRSFKRNLYDCYERYSRAKIAAYESCIRLLGEYNGYDFKIISYNSHMFTVGFKYHDEQGRECLMYITKTKREHFIIEEVE